MSTHVRPKQVKRLTDGTWLIQRGAVGLRPVHAQIALTTSQGGGVGQEVWAL